MNEEKSDDPKIIVDEDWKSQVEAEKEALKNQQQEEPTEQSELPPATFEMMISMLGTQAMATLGQLPDPMTGKPTINKQIAKHYIDLLGMLEEKTEGNLSEDESGMLVNMLHQLRIVFVNTPDEMPEMDEGEQPKESTIELP